VVAQRGGRQRVQVVDLARLAVARAIAYAIEQPADVDINEIVLRPTVQEF
jgi:NADP-dependent 3-hydroxy acid dehydrogenase YdfG